MGALTELETRARGASLEDPDVAIEDGFTLLEILGGGRRTATGRSIGQEGARKYSAVYAAVNIISSSIGTLPIKLYQRRSDGRGKDEVRQHPGWELAHTRPNGEMSAVDYKAAKQAHMLTRGNGYSEIVTGPDGQLRALWPLDPDKTSLERTNTGDPIYVTRVGGDRRTIEFENVLHIPGLGFDGRRGWSVITMARESIGLGLATEEYGARFFGNNSTPRGVLEAPETLTPEQKKTLKRGWERSQGGLENQHRVAVLEGGIEFEAIGLTAEDSQFLETRKFQIREIARWFNVPPHKIRDLEDATFSNIDAQNIEYLQDTLQPWIARWEQAMTNQLLTRDERDSGLFFEFVVDALLRADAERRAEMYNTRFATGSITPNEIRAKENENPLPEGGDEAYVQVNMMPLSQAQDMPPTMRALHQAIDTGDPEAVGEVADLHRRAMKQEREQRGDVETRQVDQRRHLVNSFRPLLEDAIGRMVRAEISELRGGLRDRLVEAGIDSWIDFLNRYYGEPFRELAARTVQPVMRSYAEAVARFVADDLDAGDPDLVVRGLMEGDGGYFDGFVDRYAGSSRGQLLTVTNRAAEADDTTPREATEQRMSEWEEGTDSGRPRHERWAEREANQENNAVAKAVMGAAGVTLLVWRAVGDSCPYCLSLDGTTVGIRDHFLAAGQAFEPDGANTPLVPDFNIGHPPVHPGCDCLVVPGG